MNNMEIKVLNRVGEVLAKNTGSDELTLVYQSEYQEGDSIEIAIKQLNAYYYVQVDDAMGPAFVYMTEEKFIYQIPFGEKRVSYSPKVFCGKLHLLTIRCADKEEIAAYKNLAYNCLDQHVNCGVYPHAVANIETRGEAVFAARNAIDGNRENHSHGNWPYESWGINRQDDAVMRVEFGRMVLTDKIIMYTRSDFPHDNWWIQATLRFSDGSELVWDLEKSDKAHSISFSKRSITWVEIGNLIKADDPSPFPALSHFEVYG